MALLATATRSISTAYQTLRRKRPLPTRREVSFRLYHPEVPRRSSRPSLLFVFAIILLCIVLIAFGWWLTRPAPINDWANGPVTPTTNPTSAPTISIPVAPPPPPPPAAQRDFHVPAGMTDAQMLLGNPSDATTNPANRDNYLMIKPYFALAYNNSAGEPRWVSWRLCASDLGTAKRKADFDSDYSLPDGFNIIRTQAYVRCGFDRGHMCDHADRASTLESSYATFIMTNIVPQAPNNNRKCWAQLENYCRELARAGDRLYITSGPAGRGGVGSDGPADSLEGGAVIVPAETWKVIVVTPDAGADSLDSVNSEDRVIAVDVPNDNDKCGEDWAGFRCSPASIEVKTGLHFFSALPSSVRTAFDSEVDAQSIDPPRPMYHPGVH